MPGSNSSGGVSMVVPEGVEVRSQGGVWAKGPLPRGTRYGPLQPWPNSHHPYSQQERLMSSNGYADPSLEQEDWMKYVRSSTTDSFNLRPVLSAGMMYFETTEEVKVGEELVLGPKDFFRPDANNDDKESGSQVSGDEKEDEEDYARCPACDTAFPEPDLLDEHLVSAHRYERGQHRCECCGKGYSWRPCLSRHKSSAHGAPVRRYPCENCAKSFSDPSNLQRHIRARHAGARSHACSECGKTFATSSGLKQHTHIHSSVKPFQCEVCYKVRPDCTKQAYTQFSNLCRHKRMHVSCRMQSKCNKCGQTFSTGTSLAKHKRFCDSNAVTSGMNNLPPGGGSAGHNPFLLYSRPHGSLPFYPTGLMGPYPSLFPSNNAQGFLPVFAPQKEEGRLRTESNSTASPASPARSESPVSLTPTSSFSVQPAKVSPPSGEEAGPSPARPSASLQPETPLSSRRSDDQPLDLSMTRRDDKRGRVSPASVCSDDSAESPPVKRPSLDPSPSPPPKYLPETPKTSPETLSVKPLSDLKEDKSSDTENNNRLPMAYPRPIHPLFLEALYRPPFPFQDSDPVYQSPFRPSFPFLGHLMARQTRSFDVMRPPLPTFPAKTFPETLPNGAPKLKDRYACKFCGKVFPRSANLTRHLRTHTGEQPYKCPYCERSFSISSNLQRHIRNIHNKEKPFKCSMCDRCFGQQTNLDRHVKKHSSEDGVISVDDSPENSNENEREDAYFDEIRSFMGKVTYGSEQYISSSVCPRPRDDSESEEASPQLSPAYSKDLPISMVLSKHLSKEEIHNNNEAEPLHIST